MKAPKFVKEAQSWAVAGSAHKRYYVGFSVQFEEDLEHFWHTLVIEVDPRVGSRVGHTFYLDGKGECVFDSIWIDSILEVSQKNYANYAKRTFQYIHHDGALQGSYTLKPEPQYRPQRLASSRLSFYSYHGHDIENQATHHHPGIPVLPNGW